MFNSQTRPWRAGTGGEDTLPFRLHEARGGSKGGRARCPRAVERLRRLATAILNRLPEAGLADLLEARRTSGSPLVYRTSSESMTYEQSSWAELFPACRVGLRSWITNHYRSSFQHVSLGNPIIPDKPTWPSTSGNCSIKQVPMRLQHIPANL